MADTTTRLALPLLAAAQAQKHVTHNEALVRLDQIVHISVKSLLTATPPVDPSENDRHIVADPADGAFAGHSGHIACFQAGNWSFITPSDGWLAWVEDDAALVAYHAGAWTSAGTAAVLPTLGVNATADLNNRLAVASDASLFNHAGTDHRLKINKAAAGNTASVVFQNGYSGRAEFGLAGEDAFSIKVSPDGIDWIEALGIDPSTGVVSLPETPVSGGGAGYAVAENLLINGRFALNQRGFAGGSLAAGAYGFDRWKAGESGANLSLSGDTLTLASGSILQVVEPDIFGLPDIAGETLHVTFDHVSGAAVTISAFGDNQIVDDVGNRPSASFQVPGGHSGTVAITLTAASGSASLARIKAEIGPGATPYQARPLPQEEILACRYFKRIEGPIALFLYAQAYGNYFFNSLPMPVTMRTVPNVTRALGAYGNIFLGNPSHAAASGLSTTAFRLSVRANAAGECYANFNSISLDAEFL